MVGSQIDSAPPQPSRSLRGIVLGPTLEKLLKKILLKLLYIDFGFVFIKKSKKIVTKTSSPCLLLLLPWLTAERPPLSTVAVSSNTSAVLKMFTVLCGLRRFSPYCWLSVID